MVLFFFFAAAEPGFSSLLEEELAFVVLKLWLMPATKPMPLTVAPNSAVNSELNSTSHSFVTLWVASVLSDCS